MNIIFLTLVRIENIEDRSLYHDLMRKFRDEGHQVYIVSPSERRLGLETKLSVNVGVHILNVKTLNVQKTNIVEKGLGTILMESQFKKAIKKHLNGVKFDLITYSTPPITLTNVVKYLKKKNPKAVSYLQLKDIFPQNAVDIGMFSASSLFYKLFRKKEKDLYKASDYIGCMSPANVEFVLKHNPEISAGRVEVAPNSLELKLDDKEGRKTKDDNENNDDVRNRYGLPTDKPVFIYGGNLGKPQGIPYLVKCMDAIKNRTDCHFVVVGSGTEQHLIQAWYDKEKPNSVTVLQALPKADYDTLVNTCEVGLIFLDHRFTIPNFPSRLLSYLENKMPVLCATDPNCDMGPIAEANGFGYWCESNSVEAFTANLDKMIHSDRKAMGEKGYEFLKANYLVENTYNAIMRHF